MSSEHSASRLAKRVPSEKLSVAFPAMHLVQTSWVVRIIGKITFAFLIASVIALIFVPWQQTARGTGRVLALDPQQRPQEVKSPYEGIVKQVREGLREGSIVTKGELVLELEPFAAENIDQLKSQIAQLISKGESAQISINLAKQAIEFQELSNARSIEASEKEVEAATQKWEQARKEVDVLKAEYDQKEYAKNQVEQLFPKGLVSELELVDKRTALNQAYAKLAKGEQAVVEAFALLSAKEQELETKRQDVSIKMRDAEGKYEKANQDLRSIEKEITDLQIKLSEFDRLTIPSPRDGLLSRIFGLEGANTVKKGDTLFTVVPDAKDLGVEMTVSGRDIPLIEVGDKVRLQFNGWPAVQFVGWPSVAVGTFGGEVVAISPTDNAMGDFSILVRPDPDDIQQNPWPDNRYLRQGVRASGWVILQQVPLGYEIWRQLNGFPPIVSDQEPTKKDGEDKPSKVPMPK